MVLLTRSAGPAAAWAASRGSGKRGSAQAGAEACASSVSTSCSRVHPRKDQTGPAPVRSRRRDDHLHHGRLVVDGARSLGSNAGQAKKIFSEPRRRDWAHHLPALLNSFSLARAAHGKTDPAAARDLAEDHAAEARPEGRACSTKEGRAAERRSTGRLCKCRPPPRLATQALRGLRRPGARGPRARRGSCVASSQADSLCWT